MSHFLDRLNFFKKTQDTFSNGHGIVTNEDRSSESSYRNRWRYDKVVRSTHGVNCTGSCSWNIHVKNGLVAFEMQATDYPRTRPDLPNHEPRGCPRGASYSWYLYSPLRVKYPLIRERLISLYRSERASGKDPVAAFAAIQNDPQKRQSYTAVRGLGGFVRIDWQEVNEIMAASLIHTIKTRGPDRIAGFSPIPAMSMISYAAGSRFLSLIGANMLSFYDWYCDLPPASPQTWGEQTDVPESADWYNSTYLIIAGSNIPMTRTPDAHFLAEVRYKGTKVVAISPDYAEYVKFADLWMPAKQGTDSAVFLAMGHVALQEFYLDRQDPYFTEYARTYTDMPLLVILAEHEESYVGSRFVRASDFADGLDEDNNPEWKTVVIDEDSGDLFAPNGSIGFRWGEEGKWNLLPAKNGKKSKPRLSLIFNKDRVVEVLMPDFQSGVDVPIRRQVPCKTIAINGKATLVATVFDLQLAQYGLDRQLGGAVASSYEDASITNTPAWAEKITGVKSADIIRSGREFADNAAKTMGKSMVIVGAGLNHWYHGDMNYRAIMNLLHICGCIGQSGGGWSHYVGQEKLRPQAGWAPIAFAGDWQAPARQMNGTSYFYMHSCQWRYETTDPAQLLASTASDKYQGYNLADYNVVSQRLGWLPSAPHFNKNPLTIVKEAQLAGHQDEKAVADYVVNQLKSGDLAFASEDIDAAENHPRVLFVWRANLVGSSAKGHEYFLKHLLGAQNGVMQDVLPQAEGVEIKWHEQAPIAKLDLMVDINFRLNSTGAYSDIVLPTATWYEKNDLNTTDMHPFIHPLTQAVDPGWESRSDWQIFQSLAKCFSAMAAEHLPASTDLVALPLLHDTPAELAQALSPLDWKKGECEPVAGKTMPALKLVERDFANTYKKYTALGPQLSKQGNGIKGIKWQTDKQYQQLKDICHTITDEGISKGMPSLQEDINVCEAILALAPETNGEVAVQSWQALASKTGIDHSHLAKSREDEKITFRDIKAQPRKIITAPTWSGIESDKVSYNACWTNIHEHIPFRTLSGRAHFYQDHQWMRDFGEVFACYRPALDTKTLSQMMTKLDGKPYLKLNWITPHGKWGIHSTYHDNLRMLTLSRGGPHLWISETDAAKVGIDDNDWVEALNINGATMARVVVSQRVPDGMALMYHAQEKNVNVPGSPSTGKRGGILNSVTRITVKPTHMIGGYAQLSYGFNYYGTVGSQRDEFVLLHKIPDPEIDWLEKPLDPQREKALNPSGVPQAAYPALETQQ